MRKLLIKLERDDYRVLVESARREEREVYQQAAYLLKRSLCAEKQAAERESERATCQ